MFSSVSASPSTSPVISPSRTTSTRSQRPISSGSSDEMTTMPTPLAREIAEDAVDLGLGADIDAAGRLVEEDDARIDRQHLGDRDLLLVAARQRRDRVVDAAALEAEAVAEPVGLLGLLPGVDGAPRGRDLAEVDAPRRWRRSTGRGRRRRPCGPPRDRRCRCRCCRDRCGWASGLPSRITSPVVPSCRPQMPLTISLRPAPIRPAMPRISPRRSVEGDVAEAAAVGEAAHLDQRVGQPLGLALLRRVELVDDAADHGVDDVVRA